MNFSNPHTILESVGIGPGSTVVDLGSGSGHYSMIASRMVGPEGRVYAVDIQKDLLERLKHTAEGEGHSNLEIVWGDIDQYGGSKLRESTADVVLLCNTLFQVQERRQAIDEALRVLRPSGRLVVVDWSDSHFGLGPDPQMVITQEDAHVLFEKVGLKEEKTLEAGEHHWGLVLRRSS